AGRPGVEGGGAVEPGGEQRLDRRRERDELYRRPRLLGEHGDELFRVERISLGHLRNARAELGRQQRAAVERLEELCRLSGRERLEADECALPPWLLLEQLGTRHAE